MSTTADPLPHVIASPALAIASATPSECLARCDAWNAQLPSAALDLRWLRVLHDGLGHTPHCLIASSGDEVVGVLPLAEISSLLFGRQLVSLPYVSSAGIVANDEHVARQLLDAAIDLADTLGVRQLQLRHELPLADHRLVPVAAEKIHMRRPLPHDADALWRDLTAKVRNQVRKAQKESFAVEWGREPLLDAFYDVFSRNMRDLGTPVFPRGLFAAMLRHFGDDAELCVLRDGARPIAGAIVVHTHGATQVPSASSLREYNSRCPNMLMYWELLSRGVARGSQTFDFGRSSEDSNTRRFKAQWGATPSPTAWQVYLRRGSADDLRPQRGGFRLASRVWRKLPLGVTRWLGPLIVRGLPS